MDTDTINANVSDIGLAIRIPCMPMNLGRMMSNGIRNKPCRDNDTNKPCFGLSVAEK